MDYSELYDGITLLEHELNPERLYALFHLAKDEKDWVGCSILYDVLYSLSKHKWLTQRDLMFDKVQKIEELDIVVAKQWILDLLFRFSIDIPKGCGLDSAK